MKLRVATLTLALALISSSAMADDVKHPLRVGFGLDVGAPSGVAVAIVVHPKVDWLSTSAALTHNGLAFGGRLSVKLDPMGIKNYPIGLFVDCQGGFASNGSIPGYSDLPSFGYQYLNLYGGLRLGRPNGFHWNFEIGPSYVHLTSHNFQGFLGNQGTGVSIGNPTMTGWLVPTFVTGFEIVW